MQAAELIAAGLCTAACLTARRPVGAHVCRCVCRGAWHGEFGDARVPVFPRRRGGEVGGQLALLGEDDLGPQRVRRDPLWAVRRSEPARVPRRARRRVRRFTRVAA